ncbi:MAG: hypothetical protein EU531_10800 [Promethearchaeota archaeon]|nr:MAG: hypothetical protein EU531_10800 [Candidatus Lokiarchaeota archaeon]
MTYYVLSVITNTGFPYYNLELKAIPKDVNLFLRFFDFSKNSKEIQMDLDSTSLFELNAGLVSALFEFARNIDKKIEIIEFNSQNRVSQEKKTSKYKGDVLITTQTEPYILHKSAKAKIKLIYDSIVSTKIPLDSALELLQNEEDTIIDILTDKVARDRIKDHESKLLKQCDAFMNDMKKYGLRGIAITSFDLSPVFVYGDNYSFQIIDEILRNVGVFPEIPPLEWIYRQSFTANEEIWVYIIKSGVGPTVNGLFQSYFYLLFAEPQSYLSEFPAKVASKFNQILG